MWKSFNLSWWIDSTSKRGEYRRDRFHVKSLTQLSLLLVERKTERERPIPSKHDSNLKEFFLECKSRGFQDLPTEKNILSSCERERKFVSTRNHPLLFPIRTRARGLPRMFFGHWECKAGGFSLAVINHRWLLSNIPFSFLFFFFFFFFSPFYRHASWTITAKIWKKAGREEVGRGMSRDQTRLPQFRGSYSNELNSKGILESIPARSLEEKWKFRLEERKIRVGREFEFEGWANVRKTLCIIYEFSFCAFAWIVPVDRSVSKRYNNACIIL